MLRIEPDSATVLLRHVVPDGSEHFDWMLSPTADGGAPLICFRCAVRLDALAVGDTAALEPLLDHGPAWLNREGAVSGGRGHAWRVASGVVRTARDIDGATELDVAWSGRTVTTLRVSREGRRVLVERIEPVEPAERGA